MGHNEYEKKKKLNEHDAFILVLMKPNGDDISFIEKKESKFQLERKEHNKMITMYVDDENVKHKADEKDEKVNEKMNEKGDDCDYDYEKLFFKFGLKDKIPPFDASFAIPCLTDSNAALDRLRSDLYI